MKKKTKFKIMLVLLYFFIFAIALAFIPTLFGVVINPITNKSFVSEGLYIFDWTVVGAQEIAACIFLWFSFTVAYIISSSNSSWKNNKGDEYGSARLLTDEEFDDILPNYMFFKNEYDIPGAKSINPPERIDEADKVVFDYFEYEEVNNYE